MENWDEDFGQPRDVWEAQAERIRQFENWQAWQRVHQSQDDAHNSLINSYTLQRQANWELCAGFHGRFELLTVDDIKFLWDCGIDPLS